MTRQLSSGIINPNFMDFQSGVSRIRCARNINEMDMFYPLEMENTNQPHALSMGLMN
jgi:hypothetical protein